MFFLAVKNPTSLDKFAANNRAATKTTTRRHKGHEQSLAKSGEEKGLDVGLGLGSTSLPAMTYRHTYTAAGAELMKGDECAALVCFRCSRQGQDNWGTEEPRSSHKAIAPAESQGNSSKRHLHSTPLRRKEQRKAQLKRSSPQRNPWED